MANIPQWFVQQWDTAIRTEASQKESRLLSQITNRGAINGEAFTINFLSDDGSLMRQNTVRYGDTEWTLENQSARVVNMQNFYEAVPLDRADIPKMLVNPVTGGDYMKQIMSRRNRRVDDLIYRAARGSQLLKDGTSIALPAGQKIAHGGTGLTKAKLIGARKLFRDNEADEFANEELCILYNGAAMEDILSDTTLTSADFMAVQMLQSGSVANKWLGFTWIPYNGIEFTSSTYYTVAFAKSGIHFGQGHEEGNVTRRADKKDAWQVSMDASYGVGRQDEKKVVEIAFQ